MAVDSYFTSVSLLLHGDTGITDVAGHSLTLGGGIGVSSAKAKFGAGSILFDGSNDYIGTSGVDFAFGSGGLFSIEFQILIEAAPTGTQVIYTNRTSSGSSNFLVNIGTDRTVRLLQNGFYRIYTAALTLNEWHQVRLVHNGTQFSLTCDTVLAGTYDSTDTWENGCTFGKDPVWNDSYFSGYLDEIRITKGVVRPNVVQTEPFPDFYGEYISTVAEVSAGAVCDATGQMIMLTVGSVEGYSEALAAASLFKASQGVISASAIVSGKSGATMPTVGESSAASLVVGRTNLIAELVAFVSASSVIEAETHSLLCAQGDIYGNSNAEGFTANVLGATGESVATSELLGYSGILIPADGNVLSESKLVGISDFDFTDIVFPPEYADCIVSMWSQDLAYVIQ